MLINLLQSQRSRQNKMQGFTLIELVIGMVILSISFSLITSLILPLGEKSAKQVHQVRASELGQSMMNEILARAFDENSDMTGGLIRCSEAETSCTSAGNLGADAGENSRADFNDVDDYNAFNFSTETNALGDSYADLYPGFSVRVNVCYSNFSNSCSASVQLAKLITIIVTTPQNFDFTFSFYKGNF